MNGQTDMARSNRLVILIKNIYTLWGRKCFLHILSDDLIYSFPLRVSCMKSLQ